MKLINLESFANALLVVGAFALAGSVTAEKSDALPVTTANSSEFINDINIGGGLDGVIKNRKIITPGSIGIYSYVADSPRSANDTVITPPTPGSHGTYGYTATSVRDVGDSTIKAAVASRTKNDRPLTGEGYVKLSKRIGGDATIGAVYYKDSIATELAARNGNLVAAAGYQFGDRHSVTGSIAYSLGAFSPFAAYKDRSMHYGAELQLGNNSALQVAYRPDGQQYSAGLRLDIGTTPAPAPKAQLLPKVAITPPPSPLKLACPSGYDEFDGGCIRTVPAPVRYAVPPSNPRGIRGRG